MRDPRGFLKREETVIEKSDRFWAALTYLFSNRTIRPYSNEEIAEHCGVDRITVKNLLDRLLYKMRLLCE